MQQHIHLQLKACTYIYIYMLACSVKAPVLRPVAMGGKRKAWQARLEPRIDPADGRAGKLHWKSLGVNMRFVDHVLEFHCISLEQYVRMENGTSLISAPSAQFT